MRHTGQVISPLPHHLSFTLTAKG